jgi:hypothetical protein
MLKIAYVARKRSTRKQRRFARMRAERPTIQQRRQLRDDCKRVCKKELAVEQDYDRVFPGLAEVFRNTYRQALMESAQTGKSIVDPIALACRAMEWYLTGEYVGPLVLETMMANLEKKG